MLSNILLVAVGGAVGCILRYLAALACQHWLGTSFPWGTLIVNIVGCLMIGGIVRLITGPGGVAEPWRMGLVVGFLGGLTTFSSFGLETFVMLSEGRTALAVVYVLISNVLGIASVASGWLLVRSLIPVA